jgi:hypothetical protein
LRQLTDEGQAALHGVAQRNGVSFDAVVTLLAALDRGNGTQAQFSHPDLGGMGQWSQGGMIMVGDMFNNGLKYRVDQLCNELSNLMHTQNLFVPTPAYGTMGSSGWWPAECGFPSSSGGQNDMQYAVFPATRRLAIRQGDQVRVYDTGQHQIGGFSQQQGGNIQDLTFTSQFGTVRLYDLPLVSGNAPQQSGPSYSAYTPPPAPVFEAPPAQIHQPAPAMPQPVPPQAQPEPIFESGRMNPEPQFAPPPLPAGAPSEDDIFAKIERLHALHTKGILSEDEFAAKKKDLLDRL